MSRHANSLDWRNMSGEALVTLLTTPGTAAALGRLNAAGRLDPGSDMASLADAVQRIVENQRWAREHRFSLPDSAAQAAADSGETAPTVSQGCLRDLMLDRINGHAPFDVAVTQVVYSDRYLAELDSRPGQRPALHLWAVKVGAGRSRSPAYCCPATLHWSREISMACAVAALGGTENVGMDFGRVRVCGCVVGCGWVGLRSAGKRYTDCCVFCASVDHCAAMRCARTAVSLCLSLRSLKTCPHMLPSTNRVD
jgi:hypothetical protein